ncbi:MAG: alpha/beta hydrolase, partial [Spartobacteria bacterium]|nr:alpha/beta hydrolase [Spartobacteria bacterium]
MLSSSALFANDTLPPLQDGKVPQTYEELWAGYDPTAEPLDVQVLNEWKVKYQGQDITVQLLNYTIGTFKGQVSRMAAYYGFPTGGAGKVPGLVDIHGGGQAASRPNVEAMAANGYACISINWGARPLPDLKPGEPNTEWGAIDATQTTHVGSFFTIAPDPKTIDDVPSPRNNNWYLV